MDAATNLASSGKIVDVTIVLYHILCGRWMMLTREQDTQKNFHLRANAVSGCWLVAIGKIGAQIVFCDQPTLFGLKGNDVSQMLSNTFKTGTPSAISGLNIRTTRLHNGSKVVCNTCNNPVREELSYEMASFKSMMPSKRSCTTVESLGATTSHSLIPIVGLNH